MKFRNNFRSKSRDKFEIKEVNQSSLDLTLHKTFDYQNVFQPIKYSTSNRNLGVRNYQKLVN
jgi:hypothetical protein